MKIKNLILLFALCFANNQKCFSIKDHLPSQINIYILGMLVMTCVGYFNGASQQKKKDTNKITNYIMESTNMPYEEKTKILKLFTEE